MKFFFDTEFVQDGKTIDLISIAIVAEDGREFYAISSEFNLTKALNHPFVSEHVTPYLHSADLWQTRESIARQIVEFVGNAPEFWADYAAYDWVALCQLFGTMMDLPGSWPMFCRDIQQCKEMVLPANFELPEATHAHHALSDAQNVKDRYDFIRATVAEILRL